MSMSRLWQIQGKKIEAQRLLADIYGWFTEGFDTADLKEAKRYWRNLHREGDNNMGVRLSIARLCWQLCWPRP